MKAIMMLSVFAACLLGSVSFAKNLSQPAVKTKIRVPTSVPMSGGFKFEVKFGEKRTQFLVWSDQQGKYFSATNGARSNSGNLSDKNYKFLNTQSAQIAGLPKTSVRACPNQKMIISLKGGAESRSACLGMKNKTAAKMTEMADVLALLL